MIADIISRYEKASGQKVNLNKLEVAFSKFVAIERRKEIVDTLGVREVEKHENILVCRRLLVDQRRLHV